MAQDVLTACLPLAVEEGLAISKDSDKKEEAWNFIEWMYSDDVQIAYQQGGYGVSVIPSVAAAAKAPDGGDLDKELSDLNVRYNAALVKAKAAGDTTVEANPEFNALDLQGSLTTK